MTLDAERLWTRSFTALWWTEAVSFFGSQLTLFAFPIVALEVLHTSPSNVAWINTAAGLGTIVLVGLLGPCSDYIERTRVMGLMSLMRAATVAGLAVWVLTGGLPLVALLGAAFVIAGFSGVYDSAFSGLLPSTVPRKRLPTANTWVAGLRSAGDIGAGAVAGFVLQLVGPAVLFLVDAVTYVISALVVRRIPEEFQPTPRRASPRAYMASLGTGFSALAEIRPLWFMTLGVAQFNLFTTAIQAVYLTHAVRSGAMTPVEVGVSGTIGGMIGLLAAAVTPKILSTLRPVTFLAATFALPAVAAWGMLLLRPGHPVANVALLAACLGFWAACVMVNVSGSETLKQNLVAGSHLGRVSAAMRLLTWGVDPLGAAMAAVLLLAFSTRDVLTIAAVGVAVSAVWVIVPSSVRALTRLGDEPDPSKA